MNQTEQTTIFSKINNDRLKHFEKRELNEKELSLFAFVDLNDHELMLVNTIYTVFDV